MDVPVSALSSWGMPVRVRKRRGKVGAGLPLEPWDEPLDEPLLYHEGSIDQETFSSESDVEDSDRLDSPPDRNSDNTTPIANAFSTEGMDRVAQADGDPEDYDRVLLEDALSSSINDLSGELENARMTKDLPPIPCK